MRYTFRCRNCTRKLVIDQSMFEPKPEKCPSCGGPLRRVYDAPNITYRGSGFYHTDHVLSDPINPLDYNPDED